MKYCLIVGESYYPEGGLDDKVGVFDSTNECFEHLLENLFERSGHICWGPPDSWKGVDWFQIINSGFEIVSRGNIEYDRKTKQINLMELSE